VWKRIVKRGTDEVEQMKVNKLRGTDEEKWMF
jgi:hypothetical protein